MLAKAINNFEMSKIICKSLVLVIRLNKNVFLFFFFLIDAVGMSKLT